MARFRIGSAFGIPIQLDVTFLLVLPVFAWLIGAQVGDTVDLLNTVWAADIPVGPLESGNLRWILGFTAAVGLFVGVVLHELGHSLVAIKYGYPISSITLWLFGGIAQLDEMPEDWRHELLIALAGPAVSVALGVVSYGAFLAVPASDGVLTIAAVKFLLGYLALMNVALAIFNMLPGFPMDGGRVLRALLARRRTYARATKIAAEVGKVFAIMLGLFGLFFGGIFMIAIAFFIYIGASGEAQMTAMKAAFEGIQVQDVMTPKDRIESVDAKMNVADLVELMFRERHTGYPVERHGDIVGLVTLEDARAVREVERDAYRVEEIMTDNLETIEPTAEAMDAMMRIEKSNIGRLLVYDGEEFVGIVTRSDLLTALNIIQSSEQFTRGPSRIDRDIETEVRSREFERP